MKTTTEETTMNTRPEAQIDEAIAEAYELLGAAQVKLDREKVSVLRTAGSRQYKSGGRYVWDMEITEAEVAIEKAIADNAHEGEHGRFVFGKSWTSITELKKDVADLAAAREARDAARGEYLARDAQYTGWSRFFLVNNTGGHIHSSMSCQTCRFDTSFSWLPSLSGLSEKDAVDAHGAILCTVCFPSAPVEWTNQYELDAAAKAADKCPGSGTYDHNSSGLSYYQKRAECNHCGHTISVTSTGKLRGHKPEGYKS